MMAVLNVQELLIAEESLEGFCAVGIGSHRVVFAKVVAAVGTSVQLRLEGSEKVKLVLKYSKHLNTQ